MPKDNWRVVNPVTFFRKFESRMFCVINSFSFVLGMSNVSLIIDNEFLEFLLSIIIDFF